MEYRMVGFSLSVVCSLARSQLLVCHPVSGFTRGRLPGGSRTGAFCLSYQRFCGASCSATSEKSGYHSSSNSSNQSTFQSPLPVHDFYELLGIGFEASRGEIRQAYRTLQKKHHPDIVGKEGHAMTLLLNKAYQTLMDENSREVYNAHHSYKQSMKGAKTFTGSPYSSWVGADRPQGIFVDENVCVGCRECVHVAPNTFRMDESTGCARVTAQWADSEQLVKMAREVCPVNCIHFVKRADLAILEYCIRPQPKASNGIYGGGWERPRNVFMAAATFKRQMEEKRAQTASVNKETPAQKVARMEAELQIRMGPFWRLWSWTGQPFGNESWSSKMDQSESMWSWKGLFGRSSTSDLLFLPISEEKVAQTISLVQEWASTFASTSELPLPMPFRTDLLPNGVQLSLITASNGTVSSIGSIVVTIENFPKSESEALEEPYNHIGKQGQKSSLRVRREGTTGTGALPGEGRIVKSLKNAVLGRDYAYSTYHLPRP